MASESLSIEAPAGHSGARPTREARILAALPSPPVVAVVAAATVVFGWLNLKFAVQMTGTTKDFGFFFASAVAFLDGKDMYSYPNLNPPHLHLLLLPVARLPVAAAWAIWNIAGAACLFLSMRAVFRELRIGVTPWRVWATTAAVIATSATTAVVLNGQVSWLLMVPITFAWIAARRQHWVRAGALLGVTMTVKPFLLVFVPYLFMARRWRALAAVAGGAMAALLVGLAVFGWDAYMSWTRTLGTVEWNWLTLNGSIKGILTRTLSQNDRYAVIASAPWMIRPLWLAGAAVIGLVTVFVARRTESPEQVDRGFALVLLAALLMSPLGWLYYLNLAVGPLVGRAMTWWQAGTLWTRRLLITAGVALYFPAAYTLALQPLPIATLILGSSYLWGMLILWLLLVKDRPPSPDVAAPETAPVTGPAAPATA